MNWAKASSDFTPLPGYGSGSRVVKLLVEVTALVTFGLLPFLWAEVTRVPSLAWTGLAMALMLGSFVSTKSWGLGDQRNAILLSIFIALYLAGAAFSYVFVADYHPKRFDQLIRTATTLLLALVLFGYGITAGSRGTLLGFIGAYAAVVVYSLVAGENFTARELYNRSESMGITVAYQQLGDSLVIASLVIMRHLRRPPFIYALAVATIPVLFIIPSRSAAVLGTVALLIACLIVSSLRVKVVIIVAAVLVLISARMIIVANMEESFEGTRHESLLTPEEDSSADDRTRSLVAGFVFIKDHPVLGYFAFELDAFEEPGLYIHNFVDVWAQAGILPFLAFLAYWTFVLRQWFLISRTDREITLAIMPILLFAMLSWIVSRSTAYPLLYFCLGYACGSLGRAKGEYVR